MKKLLITLLSVGLLVLLAYFGLSYFRQADQEPASDIVVQKEAVMMKEEPEEMEEKKEEQVIEEKEDDVMKKEEPAVMEKKVVIEKKPLSFSGNILAGSSSPFLDFNQEDYDAAMNSNKTIVLYFYADWCPLCKTEVRDSTYPAFNEFGEGLVGFQVNWRDSQDTDDEVELARKYGVSSQHTKVFIKNGERVLKTPELWSKERYIQELTDLLK